MHFSSWSRRSLLSGALLSVFGLVAVTSPAQKALRGGNSAVTSGPVGVIGTPLPIVQPQVSYPMPRPRLQLPPHRPSRDPREVAAYKAYARSVVNLPKRSSLRRAMKQIATMPVFGAGGAPGGSFASSSPGGGLTGASPFSFGTLFGSSAPHTLAAGLPVGPIGINPVLPTGGVWQNVGPNQLLPVDQIFFGPGSVSGRINACTIDPTNSRIAYIAAPVGGIWKTLNGGTTWTPTTESVATQSFSSLTIDPTNSSVLYAGSGDYDGSDEAGGGLYRSLDGGATWQNLDPDGVYFTDHSIRQTVVDPANPNNLLVAVGRSSDSIFTVDGGIYRSTNALSATPTFTPVFNIDGNCHNIVYNADRSVVYAAIESANSSSGIYSSTDNGVTWSQSPDFATAWFTDVAASKIDKNVVYAADGYADQIYKRTVAADGTVTWINTTDNFPQALDGQGNDHVWDQAFYDFYIATTTQPSDTSGIPSPPIDVVYVGLKDTYRSPNAGLTWGAIGQVSLGPNSFTFNDQMHTDQHAIGIDPSNPSNILLGNDGGVYKLRYNPLDNFNAISNANASLVVTEFYQTVFHSTSADTILGGSQDNGTSYTFGSLFGWQGVTGGDGSGVAINTKTPATMYSCYPGSQNGPIATMNINLTDDGWQTVQNISHDDPMGNSAFVQVIALDPQNYDHLYAGTNNLWLYDHAAKSWTEILDVNSANKPLTGGNVTAIAPSGIPAQGFEPIIYVGCSDGSVYSVVPDGLNPTTAVDIIKRIQFRGSVTSIVVSRVNPKRIFVTTTAGELYRCDDAVNGNFFTDITGVGQVTDPTHLPVLLPINTVSLASQDDEKIIFAGTDLGVFGSSDGGNTWGTLSVPYGLPNTKINNLDFNASTGFLNAGTFGRGVWRLPISALPITVYQKAVVHFAPVLQSYRGAKSGIRVLVEVRRPGALNTDLPVETHTATMLANGTFDVQFSTRGHYDIYLTIPRFLRKKIADVVTTTSPSLSPLMINGDANSDNVVSAADVAAITAALGRYTNSTLDLDGDGKVTSNDVVIASGNSGKRGD